MDLSLTFLGTGTSHGVPAIACGCQVCTSDDPRNQRFRCSILLEYGGRSVVIDTATEFRLQALRVGMARLDAILFTHSHADHIGGLDDVRSFSEMQGRPIACYSSTDCLEDIRRRFDYIFTPTQQGGGKPRLDLIPLEGSLDLFGLEVLPVPVLHGQLTVIGFRFGGVAYVTDCNQIPEGSMELLQGLDILILDALRWRSHPTHFSVDQALEVVARLRPARTYLTHLTHDLDYAGTNARLPQGVELAYDGLTLASAAIARSRYGSCEATRPMVARWIALLLSATALLAMVVGLVWVGATLFEGGRAQTRPPTDGAEMGVTPGEPTPSPTVDATPTPAPPQRRNPGVWQKGFAFWARSAPFGSPDSFQSLRRLRDLGANVVSPVITWYLAGAYDFHLHPGRWTPAEEDLVAIIEEAHSQGLQVVLRFHVDCDDGTWRARITPSDKAAFFASYGAVLNHYAEMAESRGVEGLVIGAELVGLTGPAHTADWQAVIAGVRQRFSGFLTYSAQWGSAPPSSPTDPFREYEQIEFWPDLDYLGISAYFELAPDGRASPSAAELLGRWEEWRQLRIEPFQARHAKPLIFTEVGYPSDGNAALHPWDGGPYRSVNLQLQSELYSALFDSWSAVPWFRGAYFWFWPTDGYGSGPTNSDYPPTGKPAEETIQRWYRRLDDMEQPTWNPEVTGGTIPRGEGR